MIRLKHRLADAGVTLSMMIFAAALNPAVEQWLIAFVLGGLAGLVSSGISQDEDQP